VFDSDKPEYTLPGARYKWWRCVCREDLGIWGRPWDHLRGPTGRGEGFKCVENGGTQDHHHLVSTQEQLQTFLMRHGQQVQRLHL
jgi:hypothetical protein